MPIKSFSKPATSAPAASSKPKAGGGKSLWDGLTGNKAQTPQLEAKAVYRVRLVDGHLSENEGTGNETAHFDWEIVDADEDGLKHFSPGDQAKMLFVVNGKSKRSSFNRIFSMFTALAGFEDVEEFRGFDPTGASYNVIMHDANGIDLRGRVVDVQVTRGNLTKSGDDYYREYSFAPVADDEEGQAALER